MIVELGHFALILAFFVALVQFASPMLGLYVRDARLLKAGEASAPVLFALIGFSFLALIYAHVASDFSVVNVFENSHSAKPLLYKISGVWGNHEGSMLLWVLILVLFGAAVWLFGANLPLDLRATVLAVQGAISRRVHHLHHRHVEPVPAHRGSARRGQRAQPDPPRPGARHPSAAALSRLCRLLDGVLLCRSPR